MQQVRWGIIGCGNVTEVKSGPAFQKARHSALVAVMRRNRELAKDYARRHNVPKWYDDADALINDPEVDAIYIATPPSSHRDYTVAAAQAGKPVYVEKPMARNFAECQEMIHACDRAHVSLFVAYYRRALPRFLKVQSLIEQREIGTIRGVTIRFFQKPSDGDLRGVSGWRVVPSISGGGYFVDLGSHMIDILQFLLGPIESAVGYTLNQGGLYEAEDVVSATFKFASGVCATGLWSFAAGENVDQTEIVGSEGSMTYATFGDSPIVVTRGGKAAQYRIGNPSHIEQPLIQSVVDELTGHGKCPSTGKTGAMTNWVMDSILGRK